MSTSSARTFHRLAELKKERDDYELELRMLNEDAQRPELSSVWLCFAAS